MRTVRLPAASVIGAVVATRHSRQEPVDTNESDDCLTTPSTSTSSGRSDTPPFAKRNDSGKLPVAGTLTVHSIHAPAVSPKSR